MSTRVGFIGLGHMGGPMCERVARAGFEVGAFDLRREAVDAAVAAAEALVIGRRAGIDLRTLHTALAAGPARSSFVENEALEVLEDGEYGERFPLGLVAKDLGMALELAHESGIPAELSARTRDLYDRVLERYGAAAGEMAVVRHYEDLAGAPLRFGAPDGG